MTVENYIIGRSKANLLAIYEKKAFSNAKESEIINIENLNDF